MDPNNANNGKIFNYTTKDFPDGMEFTALIQIPYVSEDSVDYYGPHEKLKFDFERDFILSQQNVTSAVSSFSRSEDIDMFNFPLFSENVVFKDENLFKMKVAVCGPPYQRAWDNSWTGSYLTFNNCVKGDTAREAGNYNSVEQQFQTTVNPQIKGFWFNGFPPLPADGSVLPVMQFGSPTS